jgi:hypothetical protein
VRNSEAFRLAVYAGLILLVLGIIVMAVRWFVLDGRQR